MLYQLLDSIKSNPALFLNQPSVSGLHTFLLGFQTAKNVYQLPQEEDEQGFAGFQAWVAKQYDIQTNQSWSRIISFFAKDDKDSLNLFFKLLDEYRNEASPEQMSIFTDEAAQISA